MFNYHYKIIIITYIDHYLIFIFFIFNEKIFVNIFLYKHNLYHIFFIIF